MDSPNTTENTTPEIKNKMKFEGKVLKTSLAGALIDIGRDKPGRLHISQVASSDGSVIKNITDVLKEGQTVEVWVRRAKDGVVELTMNKPLGLDWHEIKPGMTVKGNVVRLETFGVFVEIGAERPGLIHISELAHEYIKVPADVVKVGDDVEAQVLDVDKKKKQIKLSLKALQPEPEKPEVVEEPEERPAPRGDRRRSDKRRSKDDDHMSEAEIAALTESESDEPIPTAMELAMREAMERANSKKASYKAKKEKAADLRDEKEEILSRTLEKKIGRGN
ncbi:MAG TPA: S1 RNA-binding domain-containing protein [Bellilinea sp.]|nr:S1 RNA-binding domain-containing protein [Bellilinea sp.]